MTPTREAALLAVVEAARKYFGWNNLSGAHADNLRRAVADFDALPADPQPAPVVDVALWRNSYGGIALSAAGSKDDRQSGSDHWTRLGTTLLPIRATVAGGGG